MGFNRFKGICQRKERTAVASLIWGLSTNLCSSKSHVGTNKTHRYSVSWFVRWPEIESLIMRFDLHAWIMWASNVGTIFHLIYWLYRNETFDLWKQIESPLLNGLSYCGYAHQEKWFTGPIYLGIFHSWILSEIDELCMSHEKNVKSSLWW